MRGYQYDANGNLTQVTGPGARTVTWWSFNKPRRLEKDGNNHSEYWYGPDGDRALFRQSARINGQLELIWYGSALYERRYVDATVESLAYWGKRRPATTWQTPAPGVFMAVVELRRGFTLHEHIDQVGLIHMGGRVYDPELGRFLSPDPFVQFPASTQGFNRYAYVGNSPLSYTDPSGYFLKELGKAIGIGMNFIPGMQLSNVWLHGFVSGFLVSGGNAKAGVMGMMSAGMASKVGGFADAHELGNFSRSALHGVTQGAIAAAGGGRFGDGALGAFSGSFLSFIPEAVAGPYGSGGEWAKIGRMTAAAVVGGTASKIGGGKFANGAWSAAFVSRFNHDGASSRTSVAESSVAPNPNGNSHFDVGWRDYVELLGESLLTLPERMSWSTYAGIAGGPGANIVGEWALTDLRNRSVTSEYVKGLGGFAGAQMSVDVVRTGQISGVVQASRLCAGGGWSACATVQFSAHGHWKVSVGFGPGLGVKYDAVTIGYTQKY